MPVRKKRFFKAPGFFISIAAAAACVLYLAFPCLAGEDFLIRGISYGPFRAGQSPLLKIYPSSAQIEEDLGILESAADALRFYSADSSLSLAAEIAESRGLKIVLGAWLGSDEQENDREIDRLVRIAGERKNVLFAVIGNEAILRNSSGYPDGLPKHKVIKKILEVKKQVSVPVTTAEPWKVWKDNPYLAKAVDVICVNIHPYWEGVDVSRAASHVMEKVKEIRDLYRDKRVVIGEAGWPTSGDANGLSVPGVAEQERFLKEFLELAGKEKIEFFLFEAFDEEYKTAEPYGVGPYWGIFRGDRTPKHSAFSLKDESWFSSAQEGTERR